MSPTTHGWIIMGINTNILTHAKNMFCICKHIEFGCTVTNVSFEPHYVYCCYCFSHIKFKIFYNAGEYPNLPFKLSTESFTNLGVEVTKSYYCLFKSNLTPLLEQCKQDVKRWSILPLSLIGRANSVKINIVPKFLYLFQALLVYIPQTFFMSFNRMVSSFIWNNKMSRIRK